MSTNRHRTRRAAAVAAALATTTGLIAVGPSAAAHPGVFDSETCAASLTRVWTHPGRLGDDGPVLFSDAFESYVLRQPPCDVQEKPPPAGWDRDREGHGSPL